jgi:hypothetical protein
VSDSSETYQETKKLLFQTLE